MTVATQTEATRVVNRRAGIGRSSGDLPHDLLLGDFIEAFRLAAIFLAAVPVGLPLAEFFQHADLAVGLEQGLPPALDFGGHVLPLPQDLRLLAPQTPARSAGPRRAGRRRPVRAGRPARQAAATAPTPPSTASSRLRSSVVDAVGLGQRRAALVAQPPRGAATPAPVEIGTCS